MLNWKKPDPPPPELVARCREMIRSAPLGIESVVRMLRDFGYQKIGSIIVLKEVLELSTNQAKEIVHLSEAWTDRRASDDAFHEQVSKVVEEVAEGNEWITIREEPSSDTN